MDVKALTMVAGREGSVVLEGFFLSRPTLSLSPRMASAPGPGDADPVFSVDLEGSEVIVMAGEALSNSIGPWAWWFK